MGCAASTGAEPRGPKAAAEARAAATDAAPEASNAEQTPPPGAPASLGAAAQAAANVGWAAASTEDELQKTCVISAQGGPTIVIDGQSFTIPATGPSK